MSLIAMAVYDTEENQRSKYTKETLESLVDTVDWAKHRMIIIDNASCQETKLIFRWLNEWALDTTLATSMKPDIKIIHSVNNLGTANAINLALRERKPGEYFIKMDNDVVIHKTGWVDEMEEVMDRMPNQIGILGLKRRDVCESTYSINTDQRSKLIEVPKNTHGQKWYVVESCKHVMGTCTMLDFKLLDRIGYFYQMDGLYGFDDSIMCVRSALAGYLNCFMHGIDISHIDPGGDAYTEWKAKYAAGMIGKYATCEQMYKNGTLDIYYNPYELKPSPGGYHGD